MASLFIQPRGTGPFARITPRMRLAIRAGVMSLMVMVCCSRHPQKPASDSENKLMVSVAASGSWEELGYHKGDKAPDFALYSNDGQPFHLYEELKKGKPVMIINASYTCDFSRANIPSFKAIGEKFSKEVETVIVYTIDAHPSDIMSPYSTNNSVWIPPNNIRDSISIPQPRTYGERAELSKEWMEKYQINFPVLVDSPDNEFWVEFGQAPNMCYIIDEAGRVEFRETWYNGEKLAEELVHLGE